MRCQKLVSWMGLVPLLLLPASTLGESISVLRHFRDGCGATAAPALQFCKGGALKGSACTPLPETDPDFNPATPLFSPDCCEETSFCFQGDPDNDCSEPTRRRCLEGNVGDPCVDNSDCDSFACLAGDPNTLGESCSVDAQCADPFFPDDPNAICGATGDGECDVDNSTSVMGYVLQVNGESALIAQVTEITYVPQPTNTKSKRVQYNFDYQLFDLDEVVFVDEEYCQLPLRFRQEIQPTKGMIDKE